MYIILFNISGLEIKIFYKKTKPAFAQWKIASERHKRLFGYFATIIIQMC